MDFNKQVYSIYKATNVISGKAYIGFDSNWPNRQIQHQKSSNNPSQLNHNCIFHRAIRKYGWDVFKWEVIYQSYDGNYCLNEMEPHFIKEYDSYKNGYNMTLGGNGVLGRKMNEKTKEAIRKFNLGKKLSEEHKRKLSLAKIGSRGNNTGHKHSIESRMKMSAANKGKTWEEIYGIEGAAKRRNRRLP